MLLLVVLMPVALASQTNVALTYDANGNLLTNGDKRYVYDGFNRLSEVFINEMIKEKYWYDPDGQRLKKVKFHGDGSNTTIYYISKSFVGIMNASGTYDEVYYYDEYDLIAKQDAEGKKFYHPDHLGSTTLVTDESGKVVEETVYDPYGAVQEGGDQRFDYEGKETDFSGLQYFGARYYDPGKPKRWTQPDTLLPDVYDSQQLNRYAFERNNPYRYVDPTGNLITGIQAAGEGAAGPGAGSAWGYIADIQSDGRIDIYQFDTQSLGSGIGGSSGIELIFGPRTTAGDFKGKSYTGQYALSDTGPVGGGQTWSINIPSGNNGQPKSSKSYFSGGLGVTISYSGVQVYSGESNTNTNLVKTGRWIPFVSTSNSLSTNQASLVSRSNLGTNQGSNPSLSTKSDSKSAPAQSTYSRVSKFLKSIFGSKKS